MLEARVGVVGVEGGVGEVIPLGKEESIKSYQSDVRQK